MKKKLVRVLGVHTHTHTYIQILNVYTHTYIENCTRICFNGAHLIVLLLFHFVSGPMMMMMVTWIGGMEVCLRGKGDIKITTHTVHTHRIALYILNSGSVCVHIVDSTNLVLFSVRMSTLPLSFSIIQHFYS